MAKKKSNNSAPKQQVKVLYQNLGGVWYAFADLNEEIFFGSVNLQQKADVKKTTKSKKAAKASDKQAA